MSYKRWVAIFLVMVTVFLSSFALTMYITDPLLQFGKESGPLTFYTYNELYANPGIAKHYTYDTVLVGSSMAENTDVLLSNQLYDCNMVKLCYSGGTSYNMKTILNICFESGNSIDTVYWELNEYQLFNAHDAPRFPLPEYLYRSDYRQVLNYLLNFEIFYRYTIPNIQGTLAGIHQDLAIQGNMWDGEYAKEIALASYSRPSQSDAVLAQDYYLTQTKRNLQTNILSLVEEHPDTQFVFYFVPFSMLYWDDALRTGTFDATMYALEYAIGELLRHDNVKVYFFHDEWAIAEDLDNYKDYTHYEPWVNSHMTRAMADPENAMRLEDYQTTLQEMYDYVTAYDYERLFSD